MAKKSAEIIILLMILAVAILLALNTSQFFLRLDLTGSKAFTISPGVNLTSHLQADKLFAGIQNERGVTANPMTNG